MVETLPSRPSRTASCSWWKPISTRRCSLQTANGHTKLRLTYNNALQAVTAHEVIETTGTTKSEVGEIAFGIGVLLGKAAVESMLNSK